MLPPHSDHQSECLFHSLFLGCVSRGLLGFSHEDIIDFDICAHGLDSLSCVLTHDIIHIRAKPTIRGSISNKKKIAHGTTKAHREMRQPARAGVRHLLSEDFQDGFELQDVTFISPFNPAMPCIRPWKAASARG